MSLSEGIFEAEEEVARKGLPSNVGGESKSRKRRDGDFWRGGESWTDA